ETLVDEGFLNDLAAKGSISKERALEGIFAHEIGHYMVFPKDLATLVILAKMIEDFFHSKDDETKGFILQTYADMANDTASVLREDRTGPILDMRKAIQRTLDDPVNSSVRLTMLSYLRHQARESNDLDDSVIVPCLERINTPAASEALSELGKKSNDNKLEEKLGKTLKSAEAEIKKMEDGP